MSIVTTSVVPELPFLYKKTLVLGFSQPATVDRDKLFLYEFHWYLHERVQNLQIVQNESNSIVEVELDGSIGDFFST